MEYTRELGYGAVNYLLSPDYSLDMKKKGAMISILEGVLNPIPFQEIMDTETGRTKVRAVDVDSHSHPEAARYPLNRLGKKI